MENMMSLVFWTSCVVRSLRIGLRDKDKRKRSGKKEKSGTDPVISFNRKSNLVIVAVFAHWVRHANAVGRSPFNLLAKRLSTLRLTELPVTQVMPYHAHTGVVGDFHPVLLVHMSPLMAS